MAAIFGFLAVCSFAQGIFRGNILWTAAGFFFFLIAGWQLLALRGGFLRAPGAIKIEIGPESLAKISGPADAIYRRSWPRSAITAVRIDSKSTTEPASLCLQLRDEQAPIFLYSSDDREEIEWIAEQIRRRLFGAAAG